MIIVKRCVTGELKIKVSTETNLNISKFQVATKGENPTK
jgi:hypothetical protein